MKYLVSWMANRNDFLEDGAAINAEGPNSRLQRFFFQPRAYDSHLILYSTPNEGEMAHRLVEHLRGQHPERHIEQRCLEIADPSEQRQIVDRQLELLASFKEDDQVEIFYSAGSDMVRLAWFLSTQLHKKKASLFTFGQKGTNPEATSSFQPIQFETDEPYFQLRSRTSAMERYQKNFYLGSTLQAEYFRARSIASARNISVLILGETGAGKELLARFIHEDSARAKAPFEVVNCGPLLTSQELQSKLFGHAKGSFFGAESDQEGILAHADGGTLLLEDIGGAGIEVQRQILQFLHDGTFRPYGSHETRRSDVRIIATTNNDLFDSVQRGQFRADLYYRLAVVTLEVPALRLWAAREREELIDFLLTHIPKKYHIDKPKLEVAPSALEKLLNYEYRGNIRELEHVLTNCYIFVRKTIREKDLANKFRVYEPPTFEIGAWEAELIKKAFRHFRGNQTHTAQAIGWSINTLKKRCEVFGINREDYH